MFFAFFVFSAHLCHSAQDWNFNQQKYLKALEEIARKGNFNILADVPNVDIASFSLPASVPAAEALMVLSRSMNHHAWRLGNTFIVIPREKFLQREGRSMLFFRPEERPAESLWREFAAKFPSEMQPFLIPEANLLAFAAFPSERESVKETLRKWDSPRKPIKLSLNLCSQKSPNDAFSISFLSIDGIPVSADFSSETFGKGFVATFVAECPDSESINLKADFSSFTEKLVVPPVSSAGKRGIGSEPQKFNGTFSSGDFLGTWTAVIPPEKFKVVASLPQSVKEDDSSNFFPPSENASPSNLMNLVWAEKPVVEALQAGVASEGGVNLVCSTSCSGTISVFCFGEEFYYEEFMNLIAKTKNLGIRKIGNTWIVAEIGLFSDSTCRDFYITKRLQNSSAKFICTTLKNLFSNFGELSSDIQVSFDSLINAVLFGGKIRPVESAKNLLSILDFPQPRLTLNVHFSYGKNVLKETLQNPVGTALFREFRTSNGTTTLELLPVLFGEKGAIGLRWRIIRTGLKNPLSLSGWTFLPGEPGADILAVPGNEPLNLSVYGRVVWVPPPEKQWEYPSQVGSPADIGSAPLPHPDGFDKAFDSSF